MALYRIADLNIKINHKYKYLARLCEKYLHNDQGASVDFEVSPSPQDYDIDKENLSGYPDSYLESVSVYRQIARRILDYDGIVMHACVIEKDGKGYGFSAPSGTGKSTHAKLWLEAFKNDARIINGDKPILRFIDGKLYAYGTPWCGKEGYNINTKVPFECICFLSRAETNSINKIDAKTAVSRIFTQLLLPESNEQSEKFFDMVNIIFENVRFYSLGCNMDIDAAYVAYEGMKTL